MGETGAPGGVCGVGGCGGGGADAGRAVAVAAVEEAEFATFADDVRVFDHAVFPRGFSGQSINGLSERALKPFRRQAQMVFQDPYSSLNPRLRVRDIIGEALDTHALAQDRRDARIAELLDMVGLNASHASRYPHEFSGGQRQRIGIARALAVSPRLIVADEPVSALDVSIQAQVLNLMRDLRERHGLSYLFIAHDLAVVRHMSQRVAVIYFGKIVEVAPVRELFASPVHPYTRMLLRSVPRVHVGARASSETDASFGEIPSAIRPPSGCAFHDRCKYRTPHCAEAAPALREIAPAHHAACHVA